MQIAQSSARCSLMASSGGLQQLDEILDEEGNVMLIARDVDGHNTAYINGRSFDVQIDRQARSPPTSYQITTRLPGNHILLALRCANALLVVHAQAPAPATCPPFLCLLTLARFVMKYAPRTCLWLRQAQIAVT